MEEERRLRGRLSRRRPPAGGGPPNCRPWFLSEESKSEPWAALLRSTVGGNADWTPNSQPLPPLPAFPSQVCPKALSRDDSGEGSQALGEVMVLVAMTLRALLFRNLCLTQSPLCLLRSSL